jgi:hypothetical protein
VALTLPPPGPPSPHLRDLLADTDRLVQRCAAAADAPRDELATERRDEAALASLRLDGSPIEAVPSPDTVAAARDRVRRLGVSDEGPRTGTWFDAMRTFEGTDPDDPEAAVHDASLQALEFAGVVLATTSDDLVPALVETPVVALTELHRRLTEHLVAPERAGSLRLVEQAVHDASVGRIVYFTEPPERLAAELDRLAGWLTDDSPALPPLVVAGVVHLELLRLHPFDAANGRLARAAARLLLRGGGLDPDGLAAPEPELDRDRLGYHDEVARTLRRRDPTVWLERWGEAVTGGLRRSARRLGQLADVPADVAAPLEDTAAGDTFTVAEHQRWTGLDREASQHHLRALLDAGRIERDPGSRGLRFRVSGLGFRVSG